MTTASTRVDMPRKPLIREEKHASLRAIDGGRASAAAAACSAAAPGDRRASVHRRGLLPSGFHHRDVPRRVVRAHSSISALPGGLGVLADRGDDRVRHLRARRARRASGGRQVSDHIGRRPVLIAAAAVQAATMLIFATADGLSSLLIARVIQGLSVGAAVAAVGAGLLDLDRRAAHRECGCASSGHRQRRPRRRQSWCSTCRRRRT